MTQTQIVLLLSVSQYSIANEKTGEVENSGCTVRYIMSDELAHFEDGTVKGYRPAKVTLPFEDYVKFTTVPALYEMSLDCSVDSKGDVKIKPKAFKFISGVSLTKTDYTGKII